MPGLPFTAGRKQAGLALLAALMLGACATEDGGNSNANAQIGALLGTIAGIYLGAQVDDPTGRQIATVVGAAAGAYIGASLARELGARPGNGYSRRKPGAGNT